MKQPPVVQKVDNAIHWINHYPVVNALIGFPNSYPLDRNLPSGWYYPTFKQPEPGVYCVNVKLDGAPCISCATSFLLITHERRRNLIWQ